MTRIVPSQIVETINRLFTGQSRGAGTVQLTHERLFHLQGIIDLLRQLPSELLTVSAGESADLTVATAAIEMTLMRYSHGQWPIALEPVSGEDVIHTIRRVLGKCSDESPPVGTAQLSFIADQHIRESMSLEIGAVNTALQNAEWKAATVLGGAAIEALLHWKLSPTQTTQPALDNAAKSAVSSGRLRKAPPTDLDQWRLVDFIAVARELGFIEEATFKQSDTARDYRNLIHPGYASRSEQSCNRATALAVVAGLELVIGDLGRP
jgi:hypothetical protein